MCNRLHFLIPVLLALGLAVSSAQASTIIWVSFHGADDAPSAGASAAGFTEAPDKGYTDLLTANGYNVVRYITTANPDPVVLNAADLVIISRSVSSGHYQNASATMWNSNISAPMIIVNGYNLRYNRMGYTTGNTMADITGDITLTINDPTHPIFAGIPLTDGTMTNPYAGLATYPTDGTTAAGISINTDPVNADGTVLATISAAGNGPVGGMVIAEWQAGATLTHAGGAGTDTLAGNRLVFLTGSRESGGKNSQTAGMYDLYADGAQMFLNAVEYMLSAPAPGEEWIRAAYWDARYFSTWCGGGESMRDALSLAGYQILDADQLKTWMDARIADRALSVVVFCKDVAPDTVVESMSPACTLRNYLDAGGKCVWYSDIPMYYQGHSDGWRDWWGTDGSVAVLGFNAATVWDTHNPAIITPNGAAWGLTQTWDSLRATSSTGLTVLATDSAGNALAWVKHYVAGDNYRGFVRLWDTDVGTPSVEDVISVAEYYGPTTSAYAPTPPNGATDVPTDVTLSWMPGSTAAFHDVYFGTNPTPGIAEFKGRQLDTVYDYPDTLNPGTTYYWRIDEVEEGGVTIHTGNVWSFTTQGQGAGNILFEYFWGTDSTLASLLALPTFPDSPDQSELRTSFEGRINWRDNYGTHVRGYLYPPATGNYTFWIASDDQSQLWLSTDEDPAHAVQIASVPGWTPSRDFDNTGGGVGGPEQMSSEIPLEAGRRYYIEALHCEGGGGDNLAVAWQGPSIPTRTVISGTFLSPWIRIVVKATYPSPANGATDVPTDVILSWTPGSGAISHHIYFGTNQADVATGTLDTYKGSFLAPSYTPGTLANGTTYYWRIDEFDGAATYPGDVWSFTTASPPSLVGWWMLDETSGIVAYDSSGGENHGTLINGPVWITGRIYGALQFDGVDDFVSLPIGSVISSLGSCTITTWVNFSGPGVGWQRIWDFGSDEAYNMFLTPFSGAGNLRFAITKWSSGGEYQLNAPSALATDWHHVAVVIDGATKDMQMYLDSGVVATGTTQVLPRDLGNTTQNWLGRSQYSADPYFNGSLDDLRIYNWAMTPSEIADVMSIKTATNPSPSDGATLVATDVVLSWTPGSGAVSHHIYLGTNQADVAGGTPSTDMGTQPGTSYDPPGTLAYGTTYYWRVDEFDGTTTYPGDVWSFTTTGIDAPPISIPTDTSVGTWDSLNRIYTLTQNVPQCMQVDEDNLTLDGAGHTVIGPGSGNGVNLVWRTGVTVINLRISEFEFGVQLQGCNHCTVTSNTCNSNHGNGIYMVDSSDIQLLNNTCNFNGHGADNDFGIQSWGGTHCTISSNTCNGNSEGGIQTVGTTSSQLTDNTCNSNGPYGININHSDGNTLTGNHNEANIYFGIHLYYANGNTLTGNTNHSNDRGITLYGSQSNTVTGNNCQLNRWVGIHLFASTGNTIESSTFNSNNVDGIFLENSTGNTLTGNTCSSNTNRGIHLSNSSSNTLTANTCSNNRDGIWIHYSPSNILIGNNFSNNGYSGIWVYYSDGTNLTSNEASNNALYCGIGVEWSNNNTLSSNTANSNPYWSGIFLQSANNNTLTANTTSNNSMGIMAGYGSSNNTLTGNTVSNNGYRGILFVDSSNNQIYNNNMISNAVQARVEGSSSGNVFNLDKPTGGNFWSDWTTPDADLDGFVDSPYIFTGGQDDLPLRCWDSDGIPIAVEDGAPNGGDGNGDGIPDSEQGNVGSLPNSFDQEYVTIVSEVGTTLENVSAGDNPSPGDAPAGVEFPVGFLEFTVSGLAPGGSTTVTLLLPAGHTVETYWKYGRTLDNPTPHWYEFLYDGTTGAEILSDRIILHFVDGLRGDNDLTVNGQIVDPGAPAARLIQPVTIDIYPNQTPNRVYLSKNYTISVVVFGSASFNVTSLNWSTVRFGRTGTEAAPVRAPTIRDMNADGFPDAMYGFLTFKCGFQLGDTEGILTGSTTSGIKIEGRDSVLVSP